MFCHNCGKQLPDGEKYCRYCGAMQSAVSGGQSPSAKPQAPVKAKKGRFFAWLAAVFAVALLAVGVKELASPEKESGGYHFSSSADNSGLWVGQSSAADESTSYPELDIPADVPVFLWDQTLEIEPVNVYFDRVERLNGQIDKAFREMKPKFCILYASSYDSNALRDSYIINSTMSGRYYFWYDGYDIELLSKGTWNGKEIAKGCIYTLKYNMSEAQKNTMTAQVDAALSGYLSLIPSGAGQWEAGLIVHDELVRQITYDESEGTHCRDIYGALVEKSAVCVGYTVGFNYVMGKWAAQKDGSDFFWKKSAPYKYIMSNDASHCWNAVTGAGVDACIDVTWDDPDLTDAYGRPYVLHSFFGLAKDEISLIESHGTIDDTVLDGGDGTAFNYHKRCGYYLTSYDVNAVVSIFSKQYAQESNVLTVRFANDADYQRATAWREGDVQGFHDILNRIGYIGRYSFMLSESDEQIKAINVLLYYPED